MPKPSAHPKRRAESGQALTEFVVMLALMLSITLILMTLLGVFGDYSARILSLVGLKYP